MQFWGQKGGWLPLREHAGNLQINTEGRD